jgi:iron complex outermembrane recepter protein
MKMGQFRRDNHKRSIAAWLATSAMVSAAVFSAPALAQNTTAASEASTPSEAIVITGSRIARKDYTATSPIVTVDSELLEKSAAINLEANLNKLPQFSPALSQFTTSEIQANANTTPGAATVSLRQLGSNRNLVLVDGRRPTPVNGTGVVDINSIPSSAIDRVEIISGGASSTYGADAVGGVVNFILKKNFEGLNVDGQLSTTQRGDATEYRVAFLLGANIAGGRGNVMMGAERYSRDLIRRQDRPWFQSTYRNPNIQGTETFLAENYVSFVPGSGTPLQSCVNALFQGGTCGTTTFAGKGAPKTATLPNGTIVPVNFGTATTSPNLYINNDQTLFTSTSVNLGTAPNTLYFPQLYGLTTPIDGLARKKLATGVISDNNLDEILSSSQNRWTFFAKGRYDLTDNISVVGQTTFARTQVPSLLAYSVATGGFGTIIPHGSDIYTGNYLIGIPSSVSATPTVSGGSIFYTNPDYVAKGVQVGTQTGTGKYGLSCPTVGGCTNSQVFPVPNELAVLLDNRPTTPVTYNGVTYANGRNAPFLINITPEQLGRRKTDNFTTTFQVVAGFEGTIPGTDFTWDVTGSHGETTAKSNQSGFTDGRRTQAVQSAPNYGLNFSARGNSGQLGGGFNGALASCTSGMNPFVTQAWTQDCVAAITVDTQNENRLSQDMIEANLQGGLFDLPYGQLRFAVGADYRKNTIDYTPDSSATEGSSFYDTVNGIFPQGHTRGSTNVKEAYAEVLVPVLKDLPFAKVLNLELGYRISDYNSVGSVGTYKINGEWAPFDWLRFRGGYQKASRAPNLGELYTAPTENFTFGTDGDPCSRGNIIFPRGYGNYSANPGDANGNVVLGTTVFGKANPDAAKVEALCKQLMGPDAAAQYYRAGRTNYSLGGFTFITAQIVGNSNLQQETAKTYTIGGVISSPFDSPWLRRLRLSVDYYNVELTNGISLQSIDAAYRFCFSAVYNPTYALTDNCKRFIRDPATGEPGLIQITYSNLGAVSTDGIDVQADWGLTFQDVGIPIPGTFSENIQFSYLNHFKTTADQAVLPLFDYAGTLGGGEVGTSAGSYRWRLLANFSYSVGPVRLGLQWQHKPKVEQAAAVTTTSNQTTGYKAYDLFSLSGSVTLLRGLVIRGGVDNLFDTAPPFGGVNRSSNPANGQLPGGGYNSGQYDVLGRRFYVGTSYKF